LVIITVLLLLLLLLLMFDSETEVGEGEEAGEVATAANPDADRRLACSSKRSMKQ